jgi:nicotinamide-nucleotide amidase
MAESCTGGYVAHQLTCLPGASAVFKGSLVAYDYDVKTTELGVPEDVLLKTGAVSQETVEFMCTKVREKYNSDIGIGISGIAGPDGGTDDKPVGTVYVGVSDGTNTNVQCYHFHGERIKIIQRTSNAAYNMARKLVLGIS